MINAGAAVVEVLRAEGVKHVFGMPGGHVLPIYDAIYKTPEIKSYLVRHEQSAASLAAAVFQLTGEVAVCLVTAGPGATNLATGIAEAYVGALPIIVLAGRGATQTRFRGASQEVETDKLFAPITKWAVRVDRADLLPEVLQKAFNVARSGKPGPVLVDIPRDLLMQDIDDFTYVPAGPRTRLRPEAEAIERAVDALAHAERPIIVSGGGAVASDAFDAVRTLAEALAIPVLTSLSGRGILPDDHPLSVGGLGCHRNPLSKRLLREADVVLGLGARFEEMETNWRPGAVPAPGATFIQVDIDPAEIGRSVPSAAGLVGDIRLVVEDMVAAAQRRNFGTADFCSSPRVVGLGAELETIRADLDAIADAGETPIHPLRVIRAVRRAFPRDATMAVDVGCLAQHMAGSNVVLPIYEPRSMIVPSSFYGMGFVAAALPAAAIARPGRLAVAFVGDGSFQMVMNILPVAAEYRLPVTWCILNDGALGSIRDIQEHVYGARFIDTDFSFQPDFAKLAEACGCFGARVEDPEDVDAAVAAAIAANLEGRPAVIDFAVARARLQQTYDHYHFYGLQQG